MPYAQREREGGFVEPRGDLALRVLAMPADTNPRGDIFGGWIMALMDSAGKMSATGIAQCRVVTVAVSNIGNCPGTRLTAMQFGDERGGCRGFGSGCG
jgi:acyl-CoA hydrolase